MKPMRRHATYDDLVDVPEHMVAEIVDGDLYASPRPASPHTFAASTIGGDLNGAFHHPPGGGEKPGGWWILFEPELHLGSDVLVPDLAGWRRTRMPMAPNVTAFTVVPDWIAEVISPATGALDRGRKMHVYAREGVGSLWIVDPLARTLEVYRLEAGRWIVAAAHGGGETIRAEPFDAIRIDLGRWWITA